MLLVTLEENKDWDLGKVDMRKGKNNSDTPTVVWNARRSEIMPLEKYENYKVNAAKVYFLDVHHALILELVHIAGEIRQKKNLYGLAFLLSLVILLGRLDDAMGMVRVEGDFS